MTKHSVTRTLRLPVPGVDKVKIRLCVDAIGLGHRIPDLPEDERDTYVMVVQGMADLLLRQTFDAQLRGVRYSVENILGAAQPIEVTVRGPQDGGRKAPFDQVQALGEVCGHLAADALYKAFDFADTVQASLPKAA
ncbi:MAG: hypothetical protein DI601_09400 [Azospirillum brasilense]|nr:MAG: hypothetical protein DI601_09400 [Azospirillum brasilense]